MLYNRIWFDLIQYHKIWHDMICKNTSEMRFGISAHDRCWTCASGPRRLWDHQKSCVSRHHLLDAGLIGEKPFNYGESPPIWNQPPISIILQPIGESPPIWRLRKLVLGERWFHSSAKSVEDFQPLHENLGLEFGRWNGELSAAWKQEFRISQVRQRLMAP